MPRSLSHDPDRSLGLRENERAVVRLFGVAALGEIRELGARCVGDGTFASQVNRLGSPESDPESWAKLAHVMPDYLIASYTLRTFLGAAVNPQFHRGIPTDGKSLLGLALGLQRFPSHAELELAIHTERELSLVPLAEPIWSRVSPSFLETYRDRQRAAYDLRLNIQPGGREILAALRDESTFSKDLARAITGSLIQSASRLDPHDIEQIRALAREFHSKHWSLVSPEQFATERLCGLQASDGTVFLPPLALLEKVSALHHQAWNEARAVVAGVPDAPRSVTNTARALRQYVSPELLLYNLKAIAALTWILEIGLLGDERDVARTGSISPTVEISTERPHAETKAPPVTKESTANLEAVLPATPGGVLAGREFEHPHYIELIRRIQLSITQDLFKKDLSDLKPALVLVDHLPGDIREPRFVSIIDQLRRIHAQRSALIESITVGLLSGDTESAHLLTPDTMSSDILDAIPHSQRGVVKDRMRILHETKERLVSTLGGEAARLQALTELLDPAQLQAELPAIKALMRPHIVQYGTQQYRDFGGIFGDKSYIDALQTHCAEAGSILVRRKAFEGEDGKQLDGMFMYGKPGVYPEQIAPLLTTIAPHGDLSFAALFITAADRASGTYMSLLRGMAARLALQGARYSLGTVGEENIKHHNLLVSLDHVPLNAASLSLHQHNARFIPMLWELPSSPE